MPTTMNTVKFQKMGTCSCVAIELVNLDYFIFSGIFPFENSAQASAQNPKSYKVLSSNNKNLSIDNVKYYLKQGD